MIWVAPQSGESAQGCNYDVNTDSVEPINAFSHVEYFEYVTDLEPEPPPPPLSLMETYPGTGAPLSDVIAEPWERDA